MRAFFLAASLTLLAPATRAHAEQPQKPVLLLFEGRSDDPSLSNIYLRNLVEGTLGTRVVTPGEPNARKVKGAILIEIRRDEKQIIVTYRDMAAAEFSEILLLRDDVQANSDAIAQAVKSLEEAHRAPLSPEDEDRPAAPKAGAESSSDDEKEEPKPRPSGYFPFNLSFIYPMAVNVGRPNIITNADIVLLVGHIGELRGVSMGTVTYASADITGAQISAAALASGHAHGLQLGATFAYAGEGIEGVQFSGVLGWSNENARGLLLSGIASQCYKDVEGLQFSGGTSITRGQLVGGQISGVLNIGKVRGLQASSINVSAHVDGLQIGLINTARHVDGLQIGIINVARKIDGVQIGLINVTENLKGESLGLANLLKPGSIHPTVWGSNSLYGNAGFKFASTYTYSIISGALHNENQSTVGGLGLTLGVHIPRDIFVKDLHFGGDFGFYRLFRKGVAITDRDELLKTRLVLHYSLVPRLSLFVGGGAYMSIRGADTVETKLGPEFLGGLEL